MDEKRPADFEIGDFVANDSFLNYHLRCNKEDELFWEEWLLSNPGKKAMAQEAMEMLDLFFLRLPANEYQQELAKMRMKLGIITPALMKRPSLIRFLNWNNATVSKRSKGKRAIAYLVPVVLFLFAAGYYLSRQSSLQNIALTEKHNTGNKPLEFMLSDSTVVTLGINSTLRFPKLFANADRKIYLDGEATFNVKRDAAHPFKVYSDELIATVLGTVFNVKKQHGDSVVLVELLKGKLKVEIVKAGGSIVLNPNERVVYTRQDNSMYKEAWQPLTEVSAMHLNHLVFRKNNFEEIALKIKTVFGITLINKSTKNNWRFTGEFNNSTAKDIIENICLIKQLGYELNGDTIIIK